VTGRPGPAAAEEQAELQVLRNQADAAGREVADTLAALADRLADAGDPRAWARRRLSAAGANPRRAAGWPMGTGWLMLGGAAAGIIVMTAAAVLMRRRRQGT
jgi:ferric-dicitrate binding protein FerR (iron transport regulator)